MRRWIDTHCHLDYPIDGKTPLDLVQEAKEVGVYRLIQIGTSLASLSKLPELAAIEGVFFAGGIHPHEAKDYNQEAEKLLRQLALHPKCVAFGEMGLDYHYDHAPRALQQEVLREQLLLADELGLPVVVHSREAEEDLALLLEEVGPRIPVPGVIHCFSGSEAFGRKALELGYSLSFSGILTFKKSEALRSFAKTVPVERMLIETDAPFLAPVPFRGKACEPRMVVETAKVLADLKGLSLDDFASKMLQSTSRVFSKLAL
jgi:TatD DNase family protein